MERIRPANIGRITTMKRSKAFIQKLTINCFAILECSLTLGVPERSVPLQWVLLVDSRYVTSEEPVQRRYTYALWRIDWSIKPESDSKVIISQNLVQFMIATLPGTMLKPKKLEFSWIVENKGAVIGLQIKGYGEKSKILKIIGRSGSSSISYESEKDTHWPSTKFKILHCSAVWTKFGFHASSMSVTMKKHVALRMFLMMKTS